MMPGVSFEEIRNQIIDAYSAAELEVVLRERMNLRLDRVVGPGNFDYVVFQLLGWAERMGREVELIRVLTRAHADNAGMRLIYQKYGLAVPVLLQQGGQQLLPFPLPATDGGFEAKIKTTIPYLDVGVWRGQLAVLEGQVCLVEVGDMNGTTGTGFLVGPDAVLTNYHVLRPVIEEGAAAANVRCRFDYKKLANNMSAEGTLVALHNDWQIDLSKPTAAELAKAVSATEPSPDELDYALIRLVRPIGREPVDPNTRPGATSVPPRGWVQVPLSPWPITLQMPILILQHERGNALKLGMDTEGVTFINSSRTRVRYKTNTEDGSSGSPCFDINWNLIALHHFGDPAFNAFKRNDSWNQGIPIGAIRERLTRQKKDDVLRG